MPDELWTRFERYAAGHGKDDADALRELIEQAAEQAPATGAVIRPPLKWMLSHRTGDPGKVFARVTGNGNWWMLDDLLKVSSGSSCVIGRGNACWRPFPEEHLGDVLAAFAGQEHRLRLHHTENDQGPRLVTGALGSVDQPTEEGTN